MVAMRMRIQPPRVTGTTILASLFPSPFPSSSSSPSPSPSCSSLMRPYIHRQANISLSSIIDTFFSCIHMCLAHQQRERGERKFPTPHPKQTPKMHTSKSQTLSRAGHWMPSLENCDGGLKIFDGANSPHTPSAQTLTNMYAILRLFM